MLLSHVVLTNGALDKVLRMPDGSNRVLPFKLKYRLTKIKDKLTKEVKLYEEERIRLIEELGTEVKQEDGNSYKEVVGEENLKTFYEKLDEVLSTEVDVTLTRVPQEELKSIEDQEIDVSDAQLNALFTYVFESEEENES